MIGASPIIFEQLLSGACLKDGIPGHLEEHCQWNRLEYAEACKSQKLNKLKVKHKLVTNWSLFGISSAGCQRTSSGRLKRRDKGHVTKDHEQFLSGE